MRGNRTAIFCFGAEFDFSWFYPIGSIDNSSTRAVSSVLLRLDHEPYTSIG